MFFRYLVDAFAVGGVVGDEEYGFAEHDVLRRNAVRRFDVQHQRQADIAVVAAFFDDFFKVAFTCFVAAAAGGQYECGRAE